MSSSKKTGLLEKSIIIVIAGILDFSINYVFLNTLRIPLTTLDRVITTFSGFLISCLWGRLKNEKK